jgi:pilus assembly protein CpaB
MLVSAGGTESSALADDIKTGMRAITIGVNDTSGLKYMIKPNDKIDIIAQFEVEKLVQKAGGGTETKLTPTVKYLMQNIKVLAVDQVMKNSGANKYTTITLEVTPRQAMEITYTENNGLMRAVLKSPLDTDTVSLNVLTITDIIG